MSIISGTAKSAGGFYDYPIEQSLRFDGSSYLSRPFGSGGSQQAMTLSLWVKRSALGSPQAIFDVNSAIGNTPRASIEFVSSTDYISLGFNETGTSWNSIIKTNATYRDISSWYHLIISIETTASQSSDKTKLYINGAEPSLDNPTYVSSSVPFNGNYTHYFGKTAANIAYFNGYLANIQFIDGQALDPYFFGESKNGVWIPYNAFSTAGSGTATASDGDTATDSYGTNGFHLTFADGIETLNVNGSNVSAFRDKSHNTNHWKIN